MSAVEDNIKLIDSIFAKRDALSIVRFNGQDSCMDSYFAFDSIMCELIL